MRDEDRETQREGPLAPAPLRVDRAQGPEPRLRILALPGLCSWVLQGTLTQWVAAHSGLEGSKLRSRAALSSWGRGPVASGVCPSSSKKVGVRTDSIHLIQGELKP